MNAGGNLWYVTLSVLPEDAAIGGMAWSYVVRDVNGYGFDERGQVNIHC